MSRAAGINGSAVSRGAHVPVASGHREAFLGFGPASSPLGPVASFAFDSSGPAYFVCSYVEHSFLLIDTTPAGSSGEKTAKKLPGSFVAAEIAANA